MERCYGCRNEPAQNIGNIHYCGITKRQNPYKAIACKWVYRIKQDHEGKITCYKGRLVAKGFTQIPRIDFTETFAPVMRLDTLRLLLALTTIWGLKAHVVDIVGAYLNGDLKEEIYMQQPPEYNDGTGKVWKLNKTIYGL